MLLQTGTQRQIYPYGTDSEITGGGSVMHIDEIQNGIVIDHIKAGKGMELYHFLHLDELDCSVAILRNVNSQKMGKKDIIKIDSVLNMDLGVLGYMDPNMTISII